MPTPFLLKDTFICWTKLKTETILVTAKQHIRKNSICCLKSDSFIKKIKEAHIDMKRKYKEMMEGVYDNASAFNFLIQA